MDTELNIALLKYVFQNMDNAALATDGKGVLSYANPAARRLFRIPEGQSPRLWEIIPFIEENDALVQLFIDAIGKRKKKISSLVDYVNNDGQLYRLHVSLTCDEGSGSFLIVISDLTELMRVSSAFRRYTSPEIADYVLTTPGGEKQGGTEREVTILMSDLRGFTALSGRMPCGDLITMLNHYFECMSAVIDRYSGTIIEFLGDGLFVVFGAPMDQPEHAADAVACAIGMQNAMDDVNRWNREQGYPDLEMGIGIHSGTAVVGNIGSDRRMKYGCMGEVVNLAGRLETYTVGGQVFISEATAAMLPREPEIAGRHEFMPKGSREPFGFLNVTGYGEDRLRDPLSEGAEWISLPKAREITFSELEGKTVNAAESTGKLTRITADERNCILTADIPLEPLQNVMFWLGDHDFYAKVLSGSDGEYLLRFTSKSASILGLLQAE